MELHMETIFYMFGKKKVDCINIDGLPFPYLYQAKPNTISVARLKLERIFEKKQKKMNNIFEKMADIALLITLLKN